MHRDAKLYFLLTVLSAVGLLIIQQMAGKAPGFEGIVYLPYLFILLWFFMIFFGLGVSNMADRSKMNKVELEQNELVSIISSFVGIVALIVYFYSGTGVVNVPDFVSWLTFFGGPILTIAGLSSLTKFKMERSLKKKKRKR